MFSQVSFVVCMPMEVAKAWTYLEHQLISVHILNHCSVIVGLIHRKLGHQLNYRIPILNISLISSLTIISKVEFLLICPDAVTFLKLFMRPIKNIEFSLKLLANAFLMPNKN